MRKDNKRSDKIHKAKEGKKRQEKKCYNIEGTLGYVHGQFVCSAALLRSPSINNFKLRTDICSSHL